MSKQARRLLEMKEDLEALKKSNAEAEARYNARMESLRDEFNVTSLEDAERELKRQRAEAEKAEAELIEQVREIERDYGEELAKA